MKLFGQWQPPEGLVLKSLHFATDGRGFALVETDSVATMMDVVSRFDDYVEFEFVPIMPGDQAASVLAQGHAWADQHK